MAPEKASPVTAIIGVERRSRTTEADGEHKQPGCVGAMKVENATLLGITKAWQHRQESLFVRGVEPMFI